MNKIARLFNVSTPVVLKWIKAASRGIEAIPQENNAEVVMLDEVWHFVNEKNKILLWRAIDGVSRKPLGWELGDLIVTGPQKPL